jgi:ProP effector
VPCLHLEPALRAVRAFSGSSIGLFRRPLLSPCDSHHLGRPRRHDFAVQAPEQRQSAFRVCSVQPLMSDTPLPSSVPPVSSAEAAPASSPAAAMPAVSATLEDASTEVNAETQAETQAEPSPEPQADAKPSIPELPPAECGARLAVQFPALFTPGSPKPLKLRIQADIQQRAPGQFTRKTLSIFLHRHTTSTAYLKALVAATQRVDLDGAEAGEVADEHRQAAVEELERRRALHDARRAAEREAQRQARGDAAGGGRGDGAPRRGRRAPPAGDRAPASSGAPTGNDAPSTPGPVDASSGATGAAAEGAQQGAPATPRSARPGQDPRRSRDRGAPANGSPGERRGNAGARDADARPGSPLSRDDRAGGQRPRRDGDRGPGPGARPAPGSAGGGRHRGEPGGGRGAPFAQANAAHAGQRTPPAPAPEARLPEEEGARSRALLLRSYESTTLTRANFCALKGMKEADLESQLVQARQELGQRTQALRAPVQPSPAQDKAQRPSTKAPADSSEPS